MKAAPFGVWFFFEILLIPLKKFEKLSKIFSIFPPNVI